MSETAEERIPAEVFPLAEYLCEEMQARGWTTEDAAIRMGAKDEEGLARDLLSLDLIMCVHDDKLLIGDRMLKKLAMAFGVDRDFFANLDAVWRRWPDRQSPFRPPESIFGPTSRNALTPSPVKTEAEVETGR